MTKYIHLSTSTVLAVFPGDTLLSQVFNKLLVQYSNECNNSNIIWRYATYLQWLENTFEIEIKNQQGYISIPNDDMIKLIFQNSHASE